jgi:hypothetical protein
VRLASPSAALLLVVLSACGGGHGPTGGGEFTVSTQAVSLHAVQDGALPTGAVVGISLTGKRTAYVGAGYRDGSAKPSWLDLVVSGSGTTWQLAVNATTTGLAPATYANTFSIGTADADGNILATQDVTVTYTVTEKSPVLTADQASLVLGGADGLGATSQPLSFRLATVTGRCDYTVTLATSAGGTWLHASAAVGTIGPGSGSATLQVSADTAGLAPGSYAGSVQLDCVVRGVPLSKAIPVTFNVESSRLLLGATGVGLTSAPTRSVLARDVVVRSAEGRASIPWQASSDQPWLSVTASGLVGEVIHLVADPTGLPDGATTFATVTVTSPDPLVENQETIRVGLTVRSVGPVTASHAAQPTLVVASPVEPIAYTANVTGILGYATDVVGYDVFSGEAVRTFAGLGQQITALTMDPDGRYLYLYDAATGLVAEADAATGAVRRFFNSLGLGGAQKPGSGNLLVLRPGGVLVTPSSRMYDLTSGAELPDRFTGSSGYGIDPSLDGSQVADTYGAVFRLRRTALGGGRISAQYVSGATTNNVGPGQSCLGADGKSIYVAEGSPYDFQQFDLTTRAPVRYLAGGAYPTAIVCAWNGLVVGGIDDYYGTPDVFVYDGPSGDQLAAFSSSEATSYRNIRRRGLAVSADGTRLVAAVASYAYASQRVVTFRSLPASK